MCGGDLEITSGSSVATCAYCGSQQTAPNADDEKKNNLYNRANRLRFSNDFDKAAGVFESIVAEFPDEAEAYWGLCLCKYGIEYVDDPLTAKKIPTCHRTAFESIFDDSNYKNAMEYAFPEAQSLYHAEAKEIDRLQKSILEIVKTESPYDVFICYKETDESGQRTKDSVQAQDIYTALTDAGFKTFFARITLEDKLGEEFEPYIFSALNSAKVMLVVGTCFENMNATWVKNEWSRYIQIMKKEKGRSLIPCYSDMDAYDMPEEFRNLQAQDMNKVGFIQDLVRGVGKIVGQTGEKTLSSDADSKNTNQKQSFDGIRTEKEISKAIELMNAKSIGKIREAKKLFEKLSSSYDTSNEIAECEKLIAEMIKKKKKKTRMTLIILFLIIVISGGTISYIFVIHPEQQYAKAAELVQNKDFDSAIEIYNEIADYKDSSELIIETQYQEAMYQYENGQKKEALYMLKALGDYKDSADKALEIVDEVVRSEFEAGNKDEVKVLLGEFYSVKNADKIYSELDTYFKGVEEYKNKNYGQALKWLTKCVDVMDSKEMIYQSAKILSQHEATRNTYESNVGSFYIAVCDGFKKISGYKDADTLLAEYRKRMKK